ncbi:putative toxin-antitoxin system toxin component, PIN family [Peribacillus sp. SCS-26]|uniref:putative toxin-antitoxin system toxin component, PIN family n=1 Tax=Paraperibacillus marinus TaxID=3115295 RepID=UPI003906082D
MRDKLVIDTNMFVEGIFNSEENASETLLSNFDSIDARLLFSQETIGELFYILKKQCSDLQMDDEETHEILMEITTLFQNGKSVNTNYYKNRRNRLRALDVNDQMFIDAAMAGRASHVITLDKK